MKKTVLTITLSAFFILLLVVLCSCGIVSNKTMISASDIAHLAEIQEKDNLVFEWLNDYNPEKPTLVVVHGEMTGKGTTSFSMTLDEEEYTMKTGESTEYVVMNNIGYKAQGFDRNLANYWLRVASFNVVIFHWERFADESTDNVLAKIYSLPKMKYVKDDNKYETNAVPNYPLAEVFAALYVKEFENKSLKQEVRWVGNGVGADLLCASAAYMLDFVKNGTLDKKYLPDRLTLCDPYLSAADLHLSGDVTSWGASSKGGPLSIVTEFIKDFDAYAAIEVVESDEVITSDDVTTDTYAYALPKNEVAEQKMTELKTHVAYLMLRESYSRLFSASYKGQKRIALDWYLYSIIGSDDSGNAGASYAMGYPRKLTDYQNYYANYSGFNWGTNVTRPMVNNRALNNDTSEASSRGKNYALSAWTPTSYTKALTGTSFTQKQALSGNTTTDVHGNTVYRYPVADYVLSYFRSENFQCSDAKKTTVSGYVYIDDNKNGYMDDGKRGVKNARLYVTVTADGKEVDSFRVVTDESGHYSFSFADATENAEGEMVDGYTFATTHTVTIQVEPTSHDYVSTDSALTGKFYDTLRGNNFTGYTCTVTLNRYVADNPVVYNCLVKPV